MIKRVKIVFICICLLMLLIGCNSKKDEITCHTYDVETGDKIKIILDQSDDYDLSTGLPLSIMHNKQSLSVGKFIKSEYYTEYESNIKSDEKSKLIDSGVIDGNSYLFWCYNNSNFNYAILIENSNTALVIGNSLSEESARECFNKITISKEY